MTDKIKHDERYLKKVRILFRSALIGYLIPFLFLGFFALDVFFVHRTQLLFWNMFLLSMFPFGLLGLLFSIIAIVQSSKIRRLKKRIIGYHNLLMGLVVVAGGILAWILLYIQTN